MSQPEASTVVSVQTNVASKQCLYQLLSQKKREAVERRMVIEDVVE
jgi:hypothetical protein